MIKLTSKWRKLVNEQLKRSNKKPSKNAWVSPLMMISSIQVETRGDEGVDNVSERVLHRVARKIRMMRPHGQLYSVPNPYEYKPIPRAAKAASVVKQVKVQPKSRQQVMSEVLSNSQTGELLRAERERKLNSGTITNGMCKMPRAREKCRSPTSRSRKRFKLIIWSREHYEHY